MDLSRFSPGTKPDSLKERYGLTDEKVILTLGRLDSGERAKGFDQVIRLLPGLLKKHENLVYLIVGDGDDRERLGNLAARHGVTGQVIFTGQVPEQEKMLHYRLGDAYVMPSRLEGFGYVFLEAQACGLPLVGSSIDGGKDALLGGKLGQLVDPDDPAQIEKAIHHALDQPKVVSPLLKEFDVSHFHRAFEDLVVSLAGKV